MTLFSENVHVQQFNMNLLQFTVYYVQIGRRCIAINSCLPAVPKISLGWPYFFLCFPSPWPHKTGSVGRNKIKKIKKCILMYNQGNMRLHVDLFIKYVSNNVYSDNNHGQPQSILNIFLTFFSSILYDNLLWLIFGLILISLFFFVGRDENEWVGGIV